MVFIQTKSWDLIPSGLIMQIATYIVRHYRFKKNKPLSLMGVVEEVGVNGRRAFNHYDELWDILNESKSSKRYREARGGKKIFSIGESRGSK
jgi:hypothetical protein